MAPAPAARVRPYKDFLTPALHRRFSGAAGVLLLLCYAEALVFSEWDSFVWSWFPLGPVGVRTLLFFVCSFSIFILRVADLHVGVRTTAAPFHTVARHVVQLSTAQTLLWYLFSAWLYTEIYIFSAPESANLRWITSVWNERARLNERPIYLMSYFLMLAVVQASSHILLDYDRIETYTLKGAVEGQKPLDRVKAQLPALVSRAVRQSLTMMVAGPIVYSLLFREAAWSWTLMIAKMFWSLPRSTALPAISPFQINLLVRTCVGGILLTLLWEVSNLVFSEYVTQEPLKNGKSITFESRDPNGSLLTGLRGKKLQTRAFAFWELSCIAQRFDDRRKAIFEDIDRAGGSAWSQVLQVCLDNINSINDRIAATSAPPKSTPAAAEPTPTLPRLTQPPKVGNIYASSPPPAGTVSSIEHSVGAFAKAHGQSPGSPIAEQARLVYGIAKSALSPDYQKAATAEGLEGLCQSYVTRVLKTRIGWPFRLETRRRISSVVLGTPYGDDSTLLNSIEALSQLCVKSLTEDRYGNVQRDVPRIIRTYTKTIQTLDGFLKGVRPHWSDVEEEIECPRTTAILTALRSGLTELLAAFGAYASDLKLDAYDVREAKAAAALAAPPERERLPEPVASRAKSALATTTATAAAELAMRADGERRAERARERELERQRERARRKEVPEMREVAGSFGERRRR